MTLLEFINQYYDQANTGDTLQNVGQCVGLIEKWIDSLSLPHIWGNAKDLLTNADPTSYDIVYNTPDGVPVLGDVFVFGSNYGGGVGHTGIVVAASPNIVTLFEQNDGLNNGTPQCKTYVYGGVNDALGWLHPKGVVVDDQSELDALRKERDNNWNLYQATLTQLADCSSKVVSSTHVPVTVTSSGEPAIVTVSTTGTSSAISTESSTNTPVTIQPLSNSTPTKTPKTLGYLIDWMIMKIKNVLWQKK